VYPIDPFTYLAGARWYRNELFRALRSGPGAISLYYSVFTGLLCLPFSFALVKEIEIASVAVFLLMLTLSGSFVLLELWFYTRNQGLELLRRVALRCRYRMKRLNVESDLIFDFLSQLDRAPEGIPRQTNESIEALIRALDRLSETAIRYGSGGKRVFMENLRSCAVASLLFESGEIDLTSQSLGTKLRQRLDKVPCYDPEGWSLSLGARFKH
jgi:hypothetical protein